ncbi:hypothetical protein [Rhodanobacter sp. OK091]|uniref:hypothetical protein n=1 Tax=Rhodanobacter sp. OK091 TaxID=1881037 RepID=UPI0015B5A8E2|nr:hypothetical protein [Rhodanobacter sp. OK091]
MFGQPTLVNFKRTATVQGIPTGHERRKNIGGKTSVRSSSVMDFQNGIGRMIGWDIA